MDPLVTASLIGAGSSLLGGIFGSKSAKKQQNVALQQAAIDRKQQEKFARTGIQWRVEDAKKAGLHPLYALGASTQAASPVPFIPGQSPSGDHFAQAGQQVGKAIAAGSVDAKYDRYLNEELKKATVLKTRNEAAYWNAQAESTNRQMLGPGSSGAISTGAAVQGSAYPGGAGERRGRDVKSQSDIPGKDVICDADGHCYNVTSLQFDDMFMPGHIEYQMKRGWRALKRKWKSMSR